ncbi:uncharacterized protein PHACADRAFT_266235 [Phanerochaete carnosa HHB-10118-sp]|uniref:Uncharacterized protein n=1 Tax=Phanerochaete carnosa (strain HHB-10118-sp) TaxID=650164 RepID=K5WIS4_PHACS|nr:uncharacterized protein PHACADRAFT_264712 [Phanerochaete carnosa HHB-10118-sp]XP_007402805.1 uncharacterized protein PHACADRAFT_266235 [Phanerochaete carnosa HHB-10118-sp]EKM48644.1 hypothetical protein PHACADRAFT_266235 [Phanerochaete carnosa HHB-10118-sp]EKM50147.1 hypothetical protein PHACADRAFT_264712 [Phanerochaete carnosa HHB-10118-sp]
MIICPVVFGAVFSIFSEAVVLVLTWGRTADIFIKLRKLKMRMGIGELLWRDGA